jgi:hypothetical protein
VRFRACSFERNGVARLERFVWITDASSAALESGRRPTPQPLSEKGGIAGRGRWNPTPPPARLGRDPAPGGSTPPGGRGVAVRARGQEIVVAAVHRSQPVRRARRRHGLSVLCRVVQVWPLCEKFGIRLGGRALLRAALSGACNPCTGTDGSALRPVGAG